MYGDPRDLHVLTPSFPTRLSSDLLLFERRVPCNLERMKVSGNRLRHGCLLSFSRRYASGLADMPGRIGSNLKGIKRGYTDRLRTFFCCERRLPASRTHRGFHVPKHSTVR